MKGLDIKKIRKKLKLTQTEFGESLGVSLRTVQNWESALEDVSEKVRILISEKYANVQNLHIQNKQSKGEEVIIPQAEVTSNKNGNKTDNCLSKNGVSFDIEEIALFIAENEDSFMDKKIFSNIIEIRVAKRIAEITSSKESLFAYLNS